MNHIDLLNLICKNKEIINEAYLNTHLSVVKDELVRNGLFFKTAKGYRLNKSYVDFINLLLQRVDYSVVFGDYEKEHKELIYAKNRFLDTKNGHFKTQIIQLIEDIHIKFINRDNEIKAMLLKMEHENSLDIDILIEEANRINKKINELIIANEKIHRSFEIDFLGKESS